MIWLLRKTAAKPSTIDALPRLLLLLLEGVSVAFTLIMR